MLRKLDVRGEDCPSPLTKVARALAELDRSDKLIVLVDSNECLRLIRELIEVLGVSIVHVIKEEDYWKIEVKL